MTSWCVRMRFSQYFRRAQLVRSSQTFLVEVSIRHLPFEHDAQNRRCSIAATLRVVYGCFSACMTDFSCAAGQIERKNGSFSDLAMVAVAVLRFWLTEIVYWIRSWNFFALFSKFGCVFPRHGEHLASDLLVDVLGSIWRKVNCVSIDYVRPLLDPNTPRSMMFRTNLIEMKVSRTRRQNKQKWKFIINALSRFPADTFLPSIKIHSHTMAEVFRLLRCLPVCFNRYHPFACAPYKCCMLVWFHCVNWIVESATTTTVRMKHLSCVHSVCCRRFSTSQVSLFFDVNFRPACTVHAWAASFFFRNSTYQVRCDGVIRGTGRSRCRTAFIFQSDSSEWKAMICHWVLRLDLHFSNVQRLRNDMGWEKVEKMEERKGERKMEWEGGARKQKAENIF